MTEKIISIICPDCKKHNLHLKFDPSSIKRKEKIWACPSKDCHLTFPEEWFDTFTQHEKFVTRGEQKVKKSVYFIK